MRIYDISVPISPMMPTYPGDPPVNITPKMQIARGDAANVSLLSMGVGDCQRFEIVYEAVRAE